MDVAKLVRRAASAAALLALPMTAAAQVCEVPNCVRDAEIESILREYMTPIFEVAGLKPSEVYLELIEDPTLSSFAGRVSDSGEGRWTIKAAIDEGVPVPVLSASLYERFSSRGEADFQDKLLSAMRFQFGGHEEKKAAP